MRASIPFGVKYRRFSERHRGRAVHQSPLRRDQPTGRPHEAGFHLDGDDAHVVLHAARRRGHRDIQERHHRAAVRHVEGVLVFRPGVKSDFRFAAFKTGELKTQVLDERNLEAEAGI